MKLPNGNGSVYKIGKKRRRPYIVVIHVIDNCGKNYPTLRNMRSDNSYADLYRSKSF